MFGCLSCVYLYIRPSALYVFLLLEPTPLYTFSSIPPPALYVSAVRAIRLNRTARSQSSRLGGPHSLGPGRFHETNLGAPMARCVVPAGGLRSLKVSVVELERAAKAIMEYPRLVAYYAQLFANVLQIISWTRLRLFRPSEKQRQEQP